MGLTPRAYRPAVARETVITPSATRSDRGGAHLVTQRLGEARVLPRWNHGPTQIVARDGYALRHSAVDLVPLWVCEGIAKAQLDGPLHRPDSEPFVFENRKHSSPHDWPSFIQSIDWIEERRLDFMPDLDPVEQQRLESQPSAMW